MSYEDPPATPNQRKRTEYEWRRFPTAEDVSDVVDPGTSKSRRSPDVRQLQYAQFTPVFVALGGTLSTWKSEPGKVTAAVKHAIEVAGYRHLDLAHAYGNEKEIGEALKDLFARGVVRREELFLTSKVFVHRCHPGLVIPRVEETLADLGVEYLDLVLIHWPYFWVKEPSAFPPPKSERLGYTPESYLAVWRDLESAVGKGLTRHIGCSNMTAKKLAKLLEGGGPEAPLEVRPAVNQVERHPFLQQPSLKKFCDDHGIVITGFCPLGSPDRPARFINEGDPVPMADPTIKAIAARVGRTPAQVLLRWAVQSGSVAVPKSVTPARIEENLRVFDFELGEADMEAVAGLDFHQRLANGDAEFTVEGQAWEDLWDDEEDRRAGAERRAKAVAAAGAEATGGGGEAK